MAEARSTHYFKPDLVCIDDFGMTHFPPRAPRRSWNLWCADTESVPRCSLPTGPSDWGQLLGDVPAATAILDRFLQQAEIIQVTGRSYRVRNAATAPTAPASQTQAAATEKKSADQSGKAR